jgi:hypothetical protein
MPEAKRDNLANPSAFAQSQPEQARGIRMPFSCYDAVTGGYSGAGHRRLFTRVGILDQNNTRN